MNSIKDGSHITLSGEKPLVTDFMLSHSTSSWKITQSYFLWLVISFFLSNRYHSTKEVIEFLFKPGTEGRMKGDSACEAALSILFVRKGNKPVRERDHLKKKDHWWMIENYLTE